MSFNLLFKSVIWEEIIRGAKTSSCIFSIISRVRKTLHGSTDDIGWLQHTPGMAPVEDGSARFLELLQCVR